MKPRLLGLSGAILALFQGSSSSSLGLPQALAQPPRREREGGDEDPLLLVPPRIEQPSMLLAHRSHSSHSSHSSHRSHSSGGYVGGPSDYQPPSIEAPAPPPPPPRPGLVTFVAYPGGRIFIDGKLVGTDSTPQLTLKPGSYNVRVENRFVGDTNQTIYVSDGQTGIVVVKW